jgi:hypothetical protein
LGENEGDDDDDADDDANKFGDDNDNDAAKGDDDGDDRSIIGDNELRSDKSAIILRGLGFRTRLVAGARFGGNRTLREAADSTDGRQRNCAPGFLSLDDAFCRFCRFM